MPADRRQRHASRHPRAAEAARFPDLSPAPLDVAAAWTTDRSALTISVVNPTYQTQRLAFKVEGTRLATSATAWVLTAPDDMAYNEPGRPPAVRVADARAVSATEFLEAAPARRFSGLWCGRARPALHPHGRWPVGR
jgi:alpha-L-arabinofuranosidase